MSTNGYVVGGISDLNHQYCIPWSQESLHVPVGDANSWYTKERWGWCQPFLKATAHASPVLTYRNLVLSQRSKGNFFPRVRLKLAGGGAPYSTRNTYPSSKSAPLLPCEGATYNIRVLIGEDSIQILFYIGSFTLHWQRYTALHLSIHVCVVHNFLQYFPVLKSHPNSTVQYMTEGLGETFSPNTWINRTTATIQK